MGSAGKSLLVITAKTQLKTSSELPRASQTGRKNGISLKTPNLKVSLGLFPTSSSQEVLSSCKCPPLPSQRPGLVPSLPGLSASEPPQPLDPYPARGDYKSRRAPRARPAALGLGAWRPASSVRGKASRRRPCGEVSDPLVLRARWERARLPPSPGWKETKKATIKTALPSLVSAVCPVLLQLVAPPSVESVTLEWNWGQKRARLRGELRLTGGCGAELAGWDREVARLGWAHSERHTPLLPFQRRAPPGSPQSQGRTVSS